MFFGIVTFPVPWIRATNGTFVSLSVIGSSVTVAVPSTFSSSLMPYALLGPSANLRTPSARSSGRYEAPRRSRPTCVLSRVARGHGQSLPPGSGDVRSRRSLPGRFILGSTQGRVPCLLRLLEEGLEWLRTHFVRRVVRSFPLHVSI